MTFDIISNIIYYSFYHITIKKIHKLILKTTILIIKTSLFETKYTACTQCKNIPKYIYKVLTKSQYTYIYIYWGTRDVLYGLFFWGVLRECYSH